MDLTLDNKMKLRDIIQEAEKPRPGDKIVVTHDDGSIRKTGKIVIVGSDYITIKFPQLDFRTTRKSGSASATISTDSLKRKNGVWSVASDDLNKY